MIKKAIWNGVVIAESDKTVNIEGNAYFPADSIKKEFFKSSETHSTCPWKGLASYYTLTVNDMENVDAAWFYPVVSPLAKGIEGHVAFWKGVTIE
ncbi:MAG: hypothetical protein ACI8XB_001373 [Patiriisocius sp.]|jgi:uncharacterized protein (DUF427 family)